MSISNILKAAAILALTSSSAIAATYSTTLNYSGLNSYIEQPGGDVFGTDINVGDTASITHKIATASDYWSLNNTNLWVAAGAHNSGTRTGDTIVSFYNDGLLVGTSSRTNSNSRYVHIGTRVSNLVSGLQFDTLIFSYLLDATTSATNVLNTNFVTSWVRGATYNVGVSAVPIPAAVLLFAPALLGFFGFRRKLQA